MVKKFISLLPTIILVGLTGCYIGEPQVNDTVQIGYRPVYGSYAESEISFIPTPSIIENPGKIYVYGKYLLVNEQKKGIHVFDNSAPDNPVNMGFIKILGNTDMAVKDGLLYADHLGNLVSLSIDDFNAIEEKGRLPLKNWNMGLPPPAGSKFECVDSQKGIVIGWIKTQEQKNLQCYAIR
jgi:hypothetical protein